MSFPTHIGDLEKNKFVETDDGKVAVRGKGTTSLSNGQTIVDVDGYSRALATKDADVANLIRVLNGTLIKVLEQLQMITETELHEDIEEL